MGSERKNWNGDGYGGGGEAVPATAKEVVKSVKEIVNCCSEQEIYSVLKECDMDPNRAVERLLAQDTFHEVRSKRERRKEMKEVLDSRTRGSSGFSRGGKTGSGSDGNFNKSGLLHVTNNEHVKSANKGEVVSIGTTAMSSSTPHVGKSAKSDFFSTNNGRPSLATNDSAAVIAQVSSGLQTSWLGVSKGHLSMADIVRIGRASENAVSLNRYTASGVSASGNSGSRPSLHCQNHSEQHVFHDKWPINEQKNAGNSVAANTFVSSDDNGQSEHSSLRDSTGSLQRNLELDASQVSRGDVASDDVSRNTGLGSCPIANFKDTCSSDIVSSYGHHEEVSSAASDFKKLSIQESKLELPLPEDKPAVVLPNDLHLPALAADCSHLSFGKFNGSSNTASSVILESNISRNGLEEKSSAMDSSSTQFSDNRHFLFCFQVAVYTQLCQSHLIFLSFFLCISSVYDREKQLGVDVLRRTADKKNDDFPSSPQQELLRHIIPEEVLGHEYHTVASMSNPSLQKSHWVTPSLPLKQPGLHSGSQSDFTREMHAESNSIPGDLLAFLRAQSQPVGFSNALSSISNSSTSVSQVMEPSAFALPKRSAFPQDLTVQSSVHLQQLPDMEGYRSLTQNQSYMTNINSQQTFTGNPYNHYPVDMKYNVPQNRNEFLMSRLPPVSARDTHGYGNLGSSLYSPGSFLSNPSLGYTMASSNLDEILTSQYNGGPNLSSIQQHGNLSQWDYGAESRSSFLPGRTQYNLPAQQQNPASLSQYVNPGYSDLHHSQRRVVEELQRPDGFQDSPSKQLRQFWQHIH